MLRHKPIRLGIHIHTEEVLTDYCTGTGTQFPGPVFLATKLFTFYSISSKPFLGFLWSQRPS